MSANQPRVLGLDIKPDEGQQRGQRQRMDDASGRIVAFGDFGHGDDDACAEEEFDQIVSHKTRGLGKSVSFAHSGFVTDAREVEITDGVEQRGLEFEALITCTQDREQIRLPSFIGFLEPIGLRFHQG